MDSSPAALGTNLARGFSNLSTIRWPLVRSSELFQLKYGKALVEANRRPGNVPVFGTNGQCGTHDKSLFRGPGVVLGRKGQGPLGVEWVERDYWVIDTAYTLSPLRDDLDLKFAYYLIKYVGLNHLKDGTSNPSLSRDTFGAQLFPLPPKSSQRAIAQILGSLDDKIELNRRMNETLEAMARALFKSWFVDFDPVRAKAGGHTPSGMDATTAASFPSEFQDSEYGEIPRGWRECALGEVLELKRGYDLPTKKRLPGCVPVVSSSGPSGSHVECKVEGPGLVTGRYGTIGQVFLVWQDFWPLNTTLYVRDRKANEVLFCYFLLRSINFHKFSDKAAAPAVNRNHVHQEPVVCPPLEVQKLFAESAGKWLGLARANREQSEVLAQTRDVLLPKLLSGELSVCQAERALEATA